MVSKKGVLKKKKTNFTVEKPGKKKKRNLADATFIKQLKVNVPDEKIMLTSYASC